MSTVVIVAATGGWRFVLPGMTIVDLLGVDDRVISTGSLESVGIGRRVRHLGEAHRVVEVRRDGTVRRLVHQSAGYRS